MNLFLSFYGIHKMVSYLAPAVPPKESKNVLSGTKQRQFYQNFISRFPLFTVRIKMADHLWSASLWSLDQQIVLAPVILAQPWRRASGPNPQKSLLRPGLLQPTVFHSLQVLKYSELVESVNPVNQETRFTYCIMVSTFDDTSSVQQLTQISAKK